MPHASRPCLCPYTTENVSIFVENRSPRSICQSRTHTTTPWTGSKRNREIIALFKKSRSLLTPTSSSLADRPQIARNLRADVQFCAHPPKLTEPKPGNRPFFTKIIRTHQILRPYGSGSDRSTRNRRKSHVHVRCKAPPACTRQASRTRAQKPPKCTRQSH